MDLDVSCKWILLQKLSILLSGNETQTLGKGEDLAGVSGTVYKVKDYTKNWTQRKTNVEV